MALIFPAPAQIKNLLDPTDNTDAATKQYVDGAVSGGSTTNFTANSVTANTITITSNIVANNATTSNLGNIVIANYFTGSGNNLSNIQASNIVGTVANANYAEYAGNITIAAQSNITSVGTLSSLSVTGNITSGNANLGNLVTANYFTGNGSLLTGISASGGNANFANYAGNVTVSSQPNITSVGTLTSLTVNGDTTLTGNLIVTGNTNYVNSNVTYIDDPMIELGGGANGAALSSNDGMDRGTLLHYYASSTAINAFMGWKNANSEFVFASNASVDNNVTTINTLGNIRAGNANLGNAVTANYFIGNGSQLTGIVGNSANANFANYAGNITVASQPNITSVGTLTSLSVTGNISSGNANLGNLVTANYFTGSGNNLSNIQGSNVTGNVSSANVANVANYEVVTAQTSGTFYPVFVSGNTTGNYALASNAALSFNAATGVLTTGVISAGGGSGGNITGANLISANYFTGTLTTNAQPNITSLGTLTSLVVTGNISSGNANLGNAVTANYFIGNGSQLTGVIATSANFANYAGNVTVASQPNITSVGTLTSLAVTGNITSGNANLGNAATANYFIGSGNNLSNIQGANVTGNVGNALNAYAVAGANVSGQVANALVAGTVYTNAQPNITSVGTLTSLAVTGNISSGNANLGNAVVANYFIGSGNNLSNIQSSNIVGQVQNAIIAGTVYTASQPNITSVGTLTSLNVSGLLTATGTGIKVANIQDSTGNVTITTGYNSVSGDVGIAGNLTVGTSGTGNVTANYFYGNGSQLTGIGTATNSNYANYAGNVVNASQPNITSVGTLTSLAVTGNISSGNANLGNAVRGNYFIGSGNNLSNIQGANVTGTVGLANLSAYSNVTKQTTGILYPVFINDVITGNYALASNASISYDVANATLTTGSIVAGSGTGGNITGANLISANYLTGTLTTASQPNITSLGTLTSLTVTGNATAGNINTGGIVNVTNTTQATGTSTGALIVQGGASITKDLYVGGNIYVPNLISTNSTTLNVQDPLLYLSANTPYPYSYEIGFYSHFATASGSGAGNGYQHTGFVRNHSDNAWYLFSNLSEPSGGTLDLSNANIVYDSVKVGNITTLNANLGNAATANYFIGSGNNLSNIQGSNITGAVSLATYATTANAVAGANVSGAVAYATTANAVAGANVSGQVGNALVAGTVYTASQPNITSVGTLAGVTATGTINLTGASNVSLGAVSNVKVTGGSSGQYLQTDGSGNLSWVTLSVSQSSINNGNSNVTIATSNGNVTISAVGNDVVTVTGTGVNVSGTINATGNITGNYFIGNGSQLTGLTATNANFANYAGNVTVASQPNITSVGTLTSLAVTGNISSGNANLGNLVTANFFSVAGNLLSNIQASNITGTVANANFAAYAGNVTLAAQSNITSLGTLTSLSVTGNISSGNANLGNLVTANFFSGAGNLLSNIQGGNVSGAVAYATTANSVAGANVSGQVANALVAGTVYTASQPNITSLGTLSSLTVSGLLTATGTGIKVANIQDSSGTITIATKYSGVTGDVGITGNLTVGTSGSGNVTANYFIGNGSQLTGVARATAADSVANGNSNVNIPSSNGNITMSVTGNSNVVIITGTGVNVSGYTTVTGNITAGNANLGNAVVANYHIGSGNNLSNIQGANVSGQVGNALVAGTVYTNAQPNITSVGTLANLVVGNATANTTMGNGTITATGNISFTGANVSLGSVSNLKITGGTSGYYLQTDGAGNLSWAAASGGGGGGSTSLVNGNSNVIVGANSNVSVSVNGTSNVLVISNNVANVNGNVVANYFIGDGSYLTGVDKLLVGGADQANYISNGTSNINTPILNGNITVGIGGVSNTVIFTNTGVTIANSLSVGGVSNLGNIGNVKITGGSANYVMVTNGAGGLSWAPASAVYVDNFTGTGTQTTFGPLSATPTAIGQTIVNYNGVIQIRSAYTLSGANIVFSAPPAYGALIEVTTIGVTAVVGTSGGSGPTSYIQNGNSNVVVNTNSSIVFSANGNYSIASFLDTGSFINSAVTFNSTANLGPASNVIITGGTSGYVLSTDGLGNLNWVAQSGGSGGSGTGYSLANGTSNLYINTDSSIYLSANGVANIVSFLDTGSYVNTAVTFTNKSNLGPASNVKITGGTSGYYLQTDGSGNLTWAAGGTGYNISNGNSNVTVTGNSAVNISANGVANVVSILDTTSYVNSNLTMTKVTTLGSNANVKITGGTNGQVLSTDGTGNLSWTSAGGGSSSTIYVDNFTGTGLQTTFGPLSATPSSVNQTTINYNGVLQLRSSYSLSGANIVFSAPPAYGATIEVTTITAGTVNVTTSAVAKSLVMSILFGG